MSSQMTCCSAAYSHLSQEYLAPSCLLSIWWLRQRVMVAEYSHLSQGVIKYSVLLPFDLLGLIAKDPPCNL